jgi:hypothetical protein|tara:strand:+ start:816 stop:1199 length:384 start_codon:yes stop_codon:yes gene_type:complete
MENQSFKIQLKQIVKEFLDVDNEIATLQKALRERKQKKEKLSKLILGTMKTQDIQQMNINNEKLVYQVTKYNSPLTKPYLNTVLKDFFNSQEKANSVVEHILGNRSRVEKVKLKRMGEKKKNLTIEE